MPTLSDIEPAPNPLVILHRELVEIRASQRRIEAMMEGLVRILAAVMEAK